MGKIFKKFLLNLFQSLLIVVTMTSCFDSSSEEGEDGGGLFNGHKNIENILVLVPTAQKTYTENQNIDISFRHSSILTVTGSPTLELDIDGTLVQANYLSGSGSSTIKFRYTVQAGENDSDGIELASAINLNGGTINYIAGGQIKNSILTYEEIEAPQIKIDTDAPSITLINPPTPKTYLNDETLYFTVMFDESVTVAGSPRIQLDIGGVTRYATYIPSGTSNILNFQYTVENSDQDLDGIEHFSPVELNGATIKDVAGNNALITFAPFPMLTTYVQGEIPFVEDVTMPSNDTYLSGETLFTTLHFNKAVSISGTPRIAFDLGGLTRYFNYVSGDGSTDILFEHQVFAGEYDDDGIQINDSIDLNGGSIQDSDTNNADLNLTAPVTPNILVDAEFAYVTTILPPSDNTYNNGDELFFSLTFNRVVNVTGTPQLPITLDSGTIYADYIDGTATDTLIFKYTVQAGDADVTGIQIQNTLNLNGGTLISSNGLGANLDITSQVAAIDTSSVIIDAGVPYITNLTPPTDNSYMTTENIDFTVTFSSVVNITGVPRIVLDVGGSTLYANYLNGTGTNTIVFRYVVNGPDLDSDGIEISSNSIDLNGGSIRDASLVNASLDFSAYSPDLSNVLVNAAALTITSVSPPADNTYTETQDLSFTVNTSDVVNVTGTPQIQLDIGGTTKYATYDSGTGSSALVFIYTVEAGLEDNDGITLTTPLDLNGGTIQDASLNNLDLNFTLPNTSNVLVDSSEPTVAITNPADASYINIATDSATFTVDGTCSEAGQTVSIEIDATAAASPVGFICDGTNFSGTVDVTGLSEASHAFVAKISDAAANEGLSTTNNVIKDITAPSISGVTPPADGTLITGNDLDFTVNFSEAITVANTPRITVDIGGATQYNNYQAGDGTTDIVFRYTIQAGDIDNDGITWPSNLIDLNTTGELKDLAGNDAALDMTTFAPDLSNVLVNALTITSVTPPADNTYTETQDLSFTVNTSDVVNVTGTPRIQLDIGGTTKFATYDSGTGSSALVFIYTVEAGLEDNDGIVLTTPLDLNGGSIQNAALINLGLSYDLPDTSNVLVDSSDPTVAITNPADASYINIATDSATFAVDGTCSEAGQTVSIEIDATAAASPVGFVCDGTNFSGTIDVTGLTEASHAFVAKISDAAANEGVSTTNNVIKDITAPTLTLDAADDVTTANYTNYALSGTCSASEAGESIDLTFGALSNTAACLGGGTWSVTGWDVSGEADSPAITITADLTDLAGNPATQATDTVSKDTSAPTITLLTPTDSSYINAATDSTSFAVTGTCNDAGATFTLKIDGSATGSISCDGANISGSFNSTILSEASHTIELEVDDGVNPVVTSATHTFTRDVTVPEVSNITPPANTTYGSGANLDFIINFDENIFQSGSPQINIDIDGVTRNPSYQGGTGSPNITMRYTTGVEEDLDGLSFTSTTINLNGGNLTDAAGNVANLNLDLNAALPDLSAVLVDGVIPTVTIDYAPDINSVNETNYYVTGTCSENTRTVDVNIGILNFTPTCSGGTWNTGTIDVSSLADDPTLTITADHDDAAGNDAIQVSVDVVKDSANPVVTITYAPDINQSNQNDYYVSGTCSESGVIVDVFVDSVNVQPLCTAGGTWSSGLMIVSGVADGPSISVTADHSTATGASTTVVKDTTSDLVSISSASSITNSNETSYIVSGTCTSNGNIVDIYVGALNYQPNCNNGSWSTGFIDVSSLADGSVLITADHQAATQASVTVNKSSGTPSVSNLTVPLTYKTSVDLQWTLSDPGGFTINDHEIQFRLQGTPTWNNFDDGIDTSNTSYVDSLSAATVYEFRVRVQYDTSNFSDWSNIATGETKPDNPLFDSPYIVMNVGGSVDTNIVAFYDNTRVYHNGIEIAESPLAAGDVVNKTTVQFDTMDADKPIYVAGELGSGAGKSGANMMWQPTSWAAKSFSFNATRENPQQLYIYAIEDAEVTVRQGPTTIASSGGVISAGTGTTISWSVYGSYQISATGTVLAFTTSGSLPGTLSDPKPLPPSSNEIIGIPSNSMRLTTTVGNTNYNTIHSDSTAASGGLDKLDSIQINPTGNPTTVYQANSLLIIADQPVSGASYADSNGNASASFLPTNLMRKYYAINNSANWVAFASKQPGTIDIYAGGDVIGVSTPISTLTLTRSGADPNAPYKAYTNTGTETASGNRYASSVPVAAWYEPDNANGSGERDETILVGSDDLF